MEEKISEEKFNLINKKLFYILNEIKSSNPYQRVIYISIGCFAGMAKITDHGKTLEPQFNQQYPPFLNELKSLYPSAQLNLILIDPSLEEIPYCMADDETHTYFPDNVSIDENNSIYINEEKNLKVFAIRERVTYEGHLHDLSSFNLMEFLFVLTKIAIKDESLLILEDFSGRSTNKLSIYFDNLPHIKHHLNHIVFGLSLRDDEGLCYPNLLSDANKFVTFLINSRIKLFNPYFYIVNQISFDEIAIGDDVKDESFLLIQTQIELTLSLIKKKFKNTTLAFLRRLTMSLINKDDLILYSHDFNSFDEKNKLNLRGLYEEKKIVEMIKCVERLIIEELEQIIFITKTKICVRDAFEIILNCKNPYEWTKNFDILFC